METRICREIPDSTFCVSLNRADISLCPTCDPSELTQPLKICKDLVLLPDGECLFGAVWHHFGNRRCQRHPEFFQSSMKSFKIGFLHFFHHLPVGSKLLLRGDVLSGGFGFWFGGYLAYKDGFHLQDEPWKGEFCWLSHCLSSYKAGCFPDPWEGCTKISSSRSQQEGTKKEVRKQVFGVEMWVGRSEFDILGLKSE